VGNSKNMYDGAAHVSSFLIAEGKCVAELSGAIPVLAHWRLSSLPRYLQPEEVERTISSCGPTPVGRRDHVILLLLARLGLRPAISSNFVWAILIGKALGFRYLEKDIVRLGCL